MDKTKKIETFINKLIKTKPDLEEGKKLIFDAVKRIIPNYNIVAIKGLNFDRTLIEFENWLVQTITTDPLPISCKSVWFSLADTTNKEDIETGIGGEIQMTISGSKFLPQTRPKDWYKKDMWDATSKTAEIKAYKALSNSLKNYPDDVQDIKNLVFVALSVLMIINGFDIIKHEFLIYQNTLTIACGYESSEQYIIGVLAEDGFIEE